MKLTSLIIKLIVIILNDFNGISYSYEITLIRTKIYCRMLIYIPNASYIDKSVQFEFKYYIRDVRWKITILKLPRSRILVKEHKLLSRSVTNFALICIPKCLVFFIYSIIDYRNCILSCYCLAHITLTPAASLAKAIF